MKVIKNAAMLKKLRKLFEGRTGAELSKIYGVNEPSISLMKHGNRTPTKGMLDDIGMVMHKKTTITFEAKK